MALVTTDRQVGLKFFRANDLTNVPQQVNGDVGNIYGCNVINTNTNDVFVKFYDTEAGATVGTTTPIKTLLVPANGTAGITVKSVPFLHNEDILEVAVTTGAADTDATAPTTPVIIDIQYT